MTESESEEWEVPDEANVAMKIDVRDHPDTPIVLRFVGKDAPVQASVGLTAAQAKALEVQLEDSLTDEDTPNVRLREVEETKTNRGVY